MLCCARRKLGYNELHAGGAAALAPALPHLTGLTLLQLCSNDMGSAGMAALAPALQRLRGLREL